MMPASFPIARPRILVVDDTPANLVVMKHVLKAVDAELVCVASGNAALAACVHSQFAVILLDVQMPEMDGYEVAELLSREALTRDTPVIFITASAVQDSDRVRGYRLGAVDFIAKPVSDLVLLSKIRVFLDLHRSRQELQYLLRTLDERNRRLQALIDEREAAEQQALRLATHDPLTGVPNRILLMDRLEAAMQRSLRSGVAFALVYLDIDGFKPVNDDHGHHVGDLLLREITRRLREEVRQSDTVARLGGDEFALILEEVRDVPVATLAACHKICGLLRLPFHLRDPKADRVLSVEVGASLGIAFFPDHGLEAEQLLRAADDAMYAAKRAGRNRCEVASVAAGSTPDKISAPFPRH